MAFKYSSHCETYLHKYSKQVLCKWLRKRMYVGDKFKGMKNIPLELTFPKTKPMMDVYEEYPVCYDKETKQLVGLRCVEEGNRGVDCCIWKEWFDTNPKFKTKSKSFIPSYYELQKWKDRLVINFIFDVGVVDDGELKYIFEVMHTNPINNAKENFLKKYKIKTYELSAKWIMDQTKMPYEFDIIKEI